MNHPRMLISIMLSVILVGLVGLLAFVDLGRSVELPVKTLLSGTERILRLGPDDDLQVALDQAASGDVIELQVGAVYHGPFILRRHAGSGWVTIVSSANSQNPLPPAGTRVTPIHRSAMATLVSASGPVISTDPAAAWYHFIGVEVRQESRSNMLNYAAWTRRAITNLVELSASDNSIHKMPHHIVFERSYLHGDPVSGTRRGIVFNGAHMAIIDSHVAGFKSTEDSQAIAGWEGVGPFLIHNNYLEAAGENVMFGGADPSIRGRVPADITISRNHFSKPLTWHHEHISHDGVKWSVKNLLELKNAKRVLIDGNLFEHNWAQSQNGFAILFTVRNQGGKSPWSVVEDITFSNNIVRRVAAGINILGYDNNHDSGRTQHIHINNNLFYDIGGEWGSGRLLQFIGSPASIQFHHNTALQSEAFLFMEGNPIPDVDIRWNIFMGNPADISGTGTAPGQQSIDSYLEPPFTISDNLPISSGDILYSTEPIRITDSDSLSFSEQAIADFSRQQPPAGSTETPGVNFTQLCAALSSSERPVFC